ncbi:hypothetical protein BDR05DRAFT_945658 [Suillus weaverae]|nr:hypothetical protein BDR05DRAFT_945658 [Suillus weaverae]
MKLMINNYSQWYHYHVHVMKKQSIKSEDKSPTPAVTPPSLSSSSPSLKCVHIGINPVAEPVLKRQCVEVEDLDDDLYTFLCSKIVFKPCPKLITRKVPTSTSVANSLTSGTLTSESTTTTPPFNILSDTDPSSLAVKMELVAATLQRIFAPLNGNRMAIKKNQQVSSQSSGMVYQAPAKRQTSAKWFNSSNQLDFLPPLTMQMRNDAWRLGRMGRMSRMGGMGMRAVVP